MRKLMRANFYRLWKSRVFWICVAASFLTSAAFLLAKQYPSREMPSLDEMYLQIFPMLPLIHAVFAGLFLGTEYQDGTLRNKVTVGHTREEIYLSFLAVCLCAGLGILLSWALGVAVGALKYGWFLAPGKQLLLNLGIMVLLTMAEDGILTLLCLLSSNKAVTAVAAILLMLGLIVLSSGFYNSLCEPEFASAAMVTENGVEVGEPQPNPDYISGFQRKCYQSAVEALPSGQAILLANREMERPALSACASVVILVLTTAAGVSAFKRKDLK